MFSLFSSTCDSRVEQNALKVRGAKIINVDEYSIIYQANRFLSDSLLFLLFKLSLKNMGNKNSTVTPSERLNLCILQNYLVVWLDGNINENAADFQNSIAKLREVSNAVVTHTNVDKCMAFINATKDIKIFIISSGALGQTTIPMIHDLSQIEAIYIFCQDKMLCEKWAKKWSKIKGVFTNIQPICEAISRAAIDCDQNTISMGFIPASENTAKKNLNHLDQSFMYTQLLKEILLTIDFQNEHLMKFIHFYRQQFQGNPAQLTHVDKLQDEYPRHTAIWWYTYQCFLYSTLNCALRNMDIEVIVHMGFSYVIFISKSLDFIPSSIPKIVS